MIKPEVTIVVDSQTIGVDVLSPALDIELGISNALPEKIYEQYDGDYEVTPSRGEQILQTAYKVMSDDVTIKEIPYSETTNLAGGTTCYIGKEVI